MSEGETRQAPPDGSEGEAATSRRAKKRSKKQFFIVFSPEGLAPPKVVHPTHSGALYCAWEMAKNHPGATFFVMGSMSRPCLTEIEAEQAVEAA